MSKWLAAILLAALLMVGYFIHSFYIAHEVEDALRPCTSAMGNPYHSSAETIPCYENALRVDPGNNWLRMQLADEFTSAGKFNEAQPLYQKVAGNIGLYQAESRWDLLPGHMQKKMKDEADAHQTLRALQQLTAQDDAEERNFLRQHAEVSNGEITSMSEPFKQQWLQMRDQHAKDQQRLMSHLYH